MKKETLTTGNVYRALVRFAVPFMLADLLQVLYGATDLFVVGHFATTGDVTGVSIGSQVMGMLTQMLLGITTGTTVLLGQYFGARERRGDGQDSGNLHLPFWRNRCGTYRAASLVPGCIGAHDAYADGGSGCHGSVSSHLFPGDTVHCGL